MKKSTPGVSAYTVDGSENLGRMKSLKTTKQATKDAAFATSDTVYRPRARVGRDSRRNVSGTVLLKVGKGGELKVRDRTRRW